MGRLRAETCGRHDTKLMHSAKSLAPTLARATLLTGTTSWVSRMLHRELKMIPIISPRGPLEDLWLVIVILFGFLQHPSQLKGRLSKLEGRYIFSMLMQMGTDLFRWYFF